MELLEYTIKKSTLNKRKPSHHEAIFKTNDGRRIKASIKSKNKIKIFDQVDAIETKIIEEILKIDWKYKQTMLEDSYQQFKKLRFWPKDIK